jgi:hypothetical protein
MLHGSIAGDDVPREGQVSFDGGVRHVESFRPDPRMQPPSYREPEHGGWYGIEIEDGAAHLFPWLGEK